MNLLSGYLWRVICACVVCALVGAIGGEGAGSGLRKRMAGLFLALTVLSPFGDVDIPGMDTESIEADARAAVREGSALALQEKKSIITQALEAYIWNKAGELGLEVQVRVRLDGDGLPESVELTGDISPGDRKALEAVIARELGLGEEALIWSVPHQSSE